jgi:hypothetical protein
VELSPVACCSWGPGWSGGGDERQQVHQGAQMRPMRSLSCSRSRGKGAHRASQVAAWQHSQHW